MPSLNTGNAILSNPIKVETTAYNVGIGGAASSSFKLQVTGTTNLTGALTGTSATFSGDLAVDTNTLYVDSTNNRVGIGTVGSSGYLLDVFGTATFGASTTIGDKVHIGSGAVPSGAAGIGLWATGSNLFSIVGFGDMTIDSRGSFLLINPNGGNVGIGTSSPTTRLEVSSSDLNTVFVTNPTTTGATTGSGIGFKAYNGTSVTQYGGIFLTSNTWSFGTYSAQQLSIGADGTGGLALRSANSAPISFFTGGASAGVSTERMRITSGGNVGIGTSSPSNPPGFVRFLNISGTDAAITISNTSGTVKNWTLGALESGTLGIFDGTTNRFSIASTGAATFNLGSGEMRLNRTGTSEYLKANTYYLLTNGNDQYLGSETAGVNIYGGGVQRLNITGSGNMGFGVTPDAWSVGANYNGYQFKNASLYVRTGSPELYINNNAFYDGTNWKYIVTASAAKLEMVNNEFTFQNVGSGTAGATATFVDRMKITSGGQVGIGTSNANVKLYVRAEDNTSTTKYGIYVDNGVTDLIYIRNDGLFSTGNTANSPYNYSTTGRTPILNSGGILGYLASTRESKTNIEQLSDVSWLYQLNPVSFNYRKKDDEMKYTNEFNEEKWYGLIADEVEKVNEDLVFYNIKEDGTKQLAGVEYNKLIAALIKSSQEQQAQIEEQQQQINSLINR